ncbi:hypothetical protein [Nonomuraea sediminis]|uniref:hypothetical protein n=1 Tax=Nonomuraea sediminis TaxID=2835864 RepID=UPI001BDD5E72|nr:hypothetical protein [Nonomuraea sediminis]
MATIEGIYKATVTVGETVSPVLFILKAGRFEGFDTDDRRFTGTYAADPATLEVLLTAQVSYLTPVLAGEEPVRATAPFTARVPAPPDGVGVAIAADLNLDETVGSVVIERLSTLDFLK